MLFSEGVQFFFTIIDRWPYARFLSILQIMSGSAY